MRIAIVPGSFDPMTLGHVNIVERASKLFDKVIVAVMINDKKKYMFTNEQRTEIARLSCAHIPNVEVVFTTCWLAEFSIINKACAIVKGLRDENDYRYELEMAQYNARINPFAQTIFLPCEAGARMISSTVVREKLERGEDISDIVSQNAVEYIKSCK